MRQSVSDSDDSRNAGFKTIVNAFLFQPGFPFASVLTGEKINRIFRKHRGLFGENGVYSTAIVLWAFLGQVLRDREEAACQFAVASIISFARRSGKMSPRKTPVTIVELGPNFLNRRSVNSPAARSPAMPDTWQTNHGCGKHVMRNSSMDSRSQCLTRRRTRLSFLTRELRRRASGCRSLAASRFCSRQCHSWLPSFRNSLPRRSGCGPVATETSLQNLQPRKIHRTS